MYSTVKHVIREGTQKVQMFRKDYILYRVLVIVLYSEQLNGTTDWNTP